METVRRSVSERHSVRLCTLMRMLLSLRLDVFLCMAVYLLVLWTSGCLRAHQPFEPQPGATSCLLCIFKLSLLQQRHVYLRLEF